MMREARGFGIRDSSRVSQSEIPNTSDERSNVRVDVERGCCASECGCRGLCAGGLDGRGAIGLEGGASGVRGCVGGRDGGGLVCDAASGRAGHGDGVDAVDGRGDVHGGVVDFSVLREGECDKREEEDEDLLE